MGSLDQEWHCFMHLPCMWVPPSPTASALALNCMWRVIPPAQGAAMCVLLPRELMGPVCFGKAGPRPTGSIPQTHWLHLPDPLAPPPQTHWLHRPDPLAPSPRPTGSTPRPTGSITNLSLVPSDLCSDGSTVSGPMSSLAPSPQHRGEGGCAPGGPGMKWVCPAFAPQPTSLLVRTAFPGEQVGIWSTHLDHQDTGSHLPRQVGMEGYLWRLTQTRRVSRGSNLHLPRRLSSSTDAAFYLLIDV